jgi:hypothetical protein
MRRYENNAVKYLATAPPHSRSGRRIIERRGMQGAIGLRERVSAAELGHPFRRKGGILPTARGHLIGMHISTSQEKRRARFTDQ